MAPALPAWRSPDLPIRVGISSCLLGEEVRYDGGHQKDAYVTGVLARYVSLVPVCPEMEAGMGVPREPVRLVGDATAPRMLGVTSGADHTERMSEFARRRVEELARRGLGGYILKRGSPSCGMERVKLYAESGALSRSGTGLFARALGEALPLLPVEEEGRLENARRRENFITRVFAYRRLAALRESGPRPADGSWAGARAPGGAGHAHQPPRRPLRGGAPSRSGLPASAPEGADAPQSRVKYSGRARPASRAARL